MVRVTVSKEIRKCALRGVDGGGWGCASVVALWAVACGVPCMFVWCVCFLYPVTSMWVEWYFQIS